MSKKFKKYKPKALDTKSDTTYYSDYPNEPIGGDNPYYCCSYCKVSDPQINGRIENHMPWCAYRVEKGETHE